MNEINELVERGKKLLSNQNFEQALECFEQATSLEQNNPDIWNLKGVTLRSIGRYDEATECFNKSLKIDPRDKKAS